MSAQNGDTVMQEEALDEEEELPFGEEKLKVVSLPTDLYPCILRLCQLLCVNCHFHRYSIFKRVG
jgi:hypothetical protein